MTLVTEPLKAVPMQFLEEILVPLGHGTRATNVALSPCTWAVPYRAAVTRTGVRTPTKHADMFSTQYHWTCKENEFPPCQHVSAYAFSSTGAMFLSCGSLYMKFIAVSTAINWGSLETLFPKLQSSVHVFAYAPNVRWSLEFLTLLPANLPTNSYGGWAEGKQAFLTCLVPLMILTTRNNMFSKLN